MRRYLPLVIAVSALMLISPSVNAQWAVNGASVSSATNDQSNTNVAPDGAGGVFVVWEDVRNGNQDIYAQRLDPFGNPMWLADGIPIRTVAGADIDPVVISDGAGGAIIAWESPSGALKVGAQRVDADGNILWTADGVTVHNELTNSDNIRVVTDGSGGCIVTWVEYRFAKWSPYAQRIDAGGTTQWTVDGVLLCNAIIGQLDMESVSDGAGGVIAVWEDARNTIDNNIYTQRLDASGTPLWIGDGIAVCTSANSQINPAIVADGQGGAIMVWEDPRAGAEEIYAQRVRPDGGLLWTTNGEQITANGVGVSDLEIATDGSFGGIITWRDSRNGNADVFAQRVTPSGVPIWTAVGETVCVTTGNQFGVKSAPDGAGGVLVSWYDFRYLADADIFVQRMDATGTAVWTANGVAASTAAGGQENPSVASDGIGGAIVAFATGATPNIDVYAQRIERNGYWGYPAANVVSANDVAGDQGGLVNLEWDASRLDPWPAQEIVDYTIWRSISMPTAAMLLDNGVPLVGEFDRVKYGTKKAVRAQATASGSSYWQLIDSQVANSLNQYSKLVETTGDSTSASTSVNYFQVIANSATDFWVSNSIGGYSLDNLAPAAPLALLANRVGNGVELEWSPSGLSEGDFSHYAVYRSEAGGVEPVLINFLSSVEDTMMLDTTASPTLQYYYVVTAVDEHENESGKSNEAMVDLITSAGDKTPAYQNLTVLRNMPNPFGDGGTTIRFGLPQTADVTVEFYDIAGRRVATRRMNAGAGENAMRFNGRSDNGRRLSSGVYFYRITGAAETAAGKLSIVR